MRFASLDSFRGLAIAGMILVNNPGSWDHVYAPLRHADWHGYTPTDQIFPSFLFIVGAAIPFTLAHGDGGFPYGRLLRRVVVLFALGLILNAANPVLDWAINGKAIDVDTIRVMGVLQRIALAYLLAVALIAALPSRALAWAVAAILLGYWAALELVPVPGHGAGALTRDGSLARYIDAAILGPARLYQGRFDPEGLLSTLPATASVLFGYGAGRFMRHRAVASGVSGRLAVAGLACIGLGLLWQPWFPINKQLWTSSYVVYTAGWSLLLLALYYEVIEVRRQRWLGWPLEVMGRNAITLFFASGLIARVLLRNHIGDGRSLYQWFYDSAFVPWAGPLDGSLAFAVATIVIWWLVLYGLYRKRWFISL